MNKKFSLPPLSERERETTFDYGQKFGTNILEKVNEH
jgi:hypothetical protein